MSTIRKGRQDVLDAAPEQEGNYHKKQTSIKEDLKIVSTQELVEYRQWY